MGSKEARTTQSDAPASGPPRAVPIVLIVLAAVIGFFSVFAVWVKRQALETDTWTKTSSELLENEQIRDAVADFIVTQIYANVDVEGEIRRQLPPEFKGLAGPASGGLRSAATSVAQRALQEPRVQGAWEDANRVAHEQLIAFIDDDAGALSTQNGVVTLDLRSIVGTVSRQAGIGGDVAAKLPNSAARIEILRSDELSDVQSGVNLLRELAFWLTAISLLLFALAVYLARDRRREMLRAVGLAFIAVGILVLFAHGIAGDIVVDGLTDTAASEGPAQATWDIATSLLVGTGEAIIAYGIVIVLASWLAGPSVAATAVRRAITPYIRQPRFAFGGLALVLVLLFWWDPTEATHRLPLSILLIAVLALGVEMLRRQVIEEFPDEVTTWSPEATARAIAERMRDRRERRVAAGAAAAASASERRVDQLERLAKLRESGVIDERELAEEKRRVLASAPDG